MDGCSENNDTYVNVRMLKQKFDVNTDWWALMHKKDFLALELVYEKN